MPKVCPKGVQRLENGTPGAPKWCHKGGKSSKWKVFIRIFLVSKRMLIASYDCLCCGRCQGRGGKPKVDIIPPKLKPSHLGGIILPIWRNV